MAQSITAVPSTSSSAIALTVIWTGADVVRVERKVTGGRYTAIKGGLEIELGSNDRVEIDDYEAPMDVELTYRVIVVEPATGDSPIESLPVTLASNGWSWLKDPALPARNVRLDEVTSMEAEIFASRAGIFDVIDRVHPVVVAALRRDRETQLNITTKTEAQRLAMERILSSGQILLLATPGGYGWGNEYVHVGDVSEERVGVASEPTRRWTLPIAVVDRPISLSYAPATMTWADVVSDWATWSDLVDDVDSWADLVMAVPQ